MRKLMTAMAAVLVLLGDPALAQVVNNQDLSATLGTTAVDCVPANALRITLAMENLHASNNVGYCYNQINPTTGAVTTCTPVIGTKGTWTITAGTLFFWPQSNVPKNGMTCIASGASTDVSIVQGVK